MTMPAPNPFERYAKQTIPRAIQRRTERALKSSYSRHQKTDREKALEEKAQLSRQYRAWMLRWEQDTIATSTEPDTLRALLDLIRAAGMSDGKMLVETSRDPWIATQSFDVRHLVLRTISNRLIKIRLAADLPEFDDAVPGERPKVFQMCREILVRGKLK